MNKHLNLQQTKDKNHMFVLPWECWGTFQVMLMVVNWHYVKGELLYSDKVQDECRPRFSCVSISIHMFNFVYSSSELQPSSEQGLLALSALGLITSDLTLAAAALSELVKIGQKGLCLNCCGGVVLYCTNNKMLQLM
jgi:hypothetical protein